MIDADRELVGSVHDSEVGRLACETDVQVR
jgi:hypothetical protein